MKRREELFPFSFSTPSSGFYVPEIFTHSPPTIPTIRTTSTTKKIATTSKPLLSLADQIVRSQLEPLHSSSSNVVVKKKLPIPILQNRRIQNFLSSRINIINNRESSAGAFPSVVQNENRRDDVYVNSSDDDLISLNSEGDKNLTLKNDFDKNITVNSERHKNITDSVIYNKLKVEIQNHAFNLTKNISSSSNIKNNSEHSHKDNSALKNSVTKIEPVISNSRPSKPSKYEDDGPKTSFLGYVINTLTQLPVIGNVLRASVDPLYRPIVNQLQSDAGNETIMRGENNMKNWCFGVLGCIRPTYDFFHPLYRPVNLPPYPREQIDTTFYVYSREDRIGFYVPALHIEDILNSTFNPSRPTKIIIHGYLNNREETWILEMVRSFLSHDNNNVISVDWSGGAYALYSQATANTRVVALEISRLLDWAVNNLKLDVSTVHIVGHSLGAHTAGYVGEKIRGIGRITGLDPAEPYFQYMPESVRLDPSDANFVDVIHTDIDSFFALTGPRGFGLQQPVGHVDFYPNGGKDQPGCNQLLARVPITLMIEGEDIIEGINAAQTELMNCDHVRSAKLFTDSLTSNCPYLGFACSSYKKYKEGKCFHCGEKGSSCAFMGINADLWNPGNQTNVKMFLETHLAPNFCKYHYILTVHFNDKSNSKGNLRGRLEISFVDRRGRQKKFDLTSLSPVKFPRKGTKSFLLEHFEDLSESRVAHIHWTYESDLLDPLTFCVIFCKADLSVSHIRLLSVDTPSAASTLMKMRSGQVNLNGNEILNGGDLIMCHEDGKIAKIPNESSAKMTVSDECRTLIEETKKDEKDDSFISKVQKVALQYFDDKN